MRAFLIDLAALVALGLILTAIAAWLTIAHYIIAAPLPV